MNHPGAIQAAMDEAVRDGVFPGGVLAGRRNGDLKVLLVAGRLSSEPTAEGVQASTVYDLASLTKPLATVTSVLLLIQAGKLELDAAIGDVLVELKSAAIGSASLRDLLTHRSGLPGWRPLYERLDAEGLAWGRGDPSIVRQAVLRLIADEPLLSAIGTQSVYSDLGFILLGCAVERASGQLLDEYFDAAVCQRLGAGPLFFRRASAALSQGQDNRAALSFAPTEWDEWRKRLLKGEVHDENAAAMGGVAGHAGLFGTAEAVLAVSGAWLGAYHGDGALLDRRLVREFIRTPSHPPHASWALGWDTPTAPSSSGTHFSAESFGHLGFTGTSLWIDPLRKLEVVLLTNRVHPSRTNDAIRAFRPRIHDLIYGELTRD
ncbi:MAG TPA: serine hydrolase [Nitrospira sp.]|nr:serine hydrolase [Nitrospira sp.]